MAGGIFITLYDINTLELYLQKGIYSFLMQPQFGTPSSHSRHFHALADYACAREGMHVFFFLKRNIVYGGQIIGNKNIGSFFINGIYSPLGKEINASFFWDESSRYIPTNKKGIFLVNGIEKCQPYILLFKDLLNLKRKKIITDTFYFKLGKYGYPLPSNAIQNMSFCIMSPGETTILLNLLKKSSEYFYNAQNFENFTVGKNKYIFKTKYGIQDIKLAYENNDLINEAHLEASILANPHLFPNSSIRPKSTDILCRQAPISPFKSYQMDRVDICYYNENEPINDGTVPNVIIELKKNKAVKKDIKQLEKYLTWVKIILGKKFKDIDIKAYMFAPDYSENSLKSIDISFKERIELFTFSGEIYN